jgi:hypothetical protein
MVPIGGIARAIGLELNGGTVVIEIVAASVWPLDG